MRFKFPADVEGGERDVGLPPPGQPLEEALAVVGDRQPGGNCIKIGLPGKSILGYYFQENRTSPRPFLLLSFLGRPIFIQFIPAPARRPLHLQAERLAGVHVQRWVADGGLK